MSDAPAGLTPVNRSPNVSIAVGVAGEKLEVGDILVLRNGYLYRARWADDIRGVGYLPDAVEAVLRRVDE